MVQRILVLLAVVCLTLPSSAKDKKKDQLPESILRAHYVAVIGDPDAGISTTDPGGDRVARRDVEAALEKWGRFHITLDTSNADLIVVLRKAKKAGAPTIGGGNPNDGPVVMDPSGNGDVRIGTTVGRPPRASDSDATWGRGPTARSEIGPSEDMFSVYSGRATDPLDSPPLWRYSGRNALRHPSVPAVDKFRKAIGDSEQAKP